VVDVVQEYLAVDPIRVYDILMNSRVDLWEFGQGIIDYLQRTGALDDEATYE
jgi:hypothetical protein